MTTTTQTNSETKVGAAFATTREVIEKFGWGCHCAPDAFYAHIVNATKEYLDRQPDGYKPTKDKVASSHWKLLAIWFANGREDLQKSLLDDTVYCWQDFGFPAGITKSVHETIVEVEARLATKE